MLLLSIICKDIYSEGRDKKPDLVKAHVWENLSSEKGVDASLRDSFMYKLNVTQQRQVKEMIAQCLATKYKKCD